MNKKLLMALLLALPVATKADIVNRDAAALRATEYLDGITTNHTLHAVTESARLAPRRKAKTLGGGSATSDAPAYYVFSRGTGRGYVIVSADDQTDPVLGYTDSGDFDYSALPDNMRSWLDDCEAQLLDLRRVSQTGADGRARAPQRAAAVPTHPAIPYLMTTKWNQGSPYNNECPLYTDGKRCVTGCVATAMAQVMYHQRAKSVTATTRAIPSYNTGEIQVAGIAKGSPLDWDNMRDDGGSTSKQQLAVAQLMHYCGVSVEMGYTSGSSGAYSSKVADALKNYFGYGSNPQYVYRGSYSNVQWDALFYEQLAAGNPIYLSGANSAAGHAFVCDGYDGKRNYHINWGWGGQSDGYYLLNKLTPGSQGIGGSADGYNDYQEAVVNIVPANYSKNIMPIEDATVKRLCVAAWDSDGDGSLSFGEAAKVTDLGDTFKGTRIKAFTELRDFTKVKAIADDAFSGCTQLASLTLPEGVTSIGARAFSGCRALKTLLVPDGVKSVGEEAFKDCRVLASPALPAIERIEARTFEGCSAMSAFEILPTVSYIGDGAFAGCTKLKTVTVSAADPAAITLGDAVFGELDLSGATLNIPAGSHAAYEAAAQWNAFGNMYEVRQVPDDKFIDLTTDRVVYLYNVGAQAYMTKGEAWGTQAIVGSEPMRFELRRDADMAEGRYYLYSDDTGNASRHCLFRTMSDDKVGTGVKCCFVDGDPGPNTHWVVEDLGNKTYRLSVPQGSTGYTANRYLGIQPSHRSGAKPTGVSTTMGAYFDIAWDGHEEACQWRFVDVDATYGVYNAAEELQNLLTLAKSKRINVEREQAVLDDMSSSKEDLLRSQRTLRKKLGFIHFNDETARDIVLANWDLDGNGELSYAEAAMVEGLDTKFTATNVSDLSELEYFTGVTKLYGNSFENCSKLEKIVVPAGVTHMYYRVFMNCTALTEIFIPAHVERIGDNNFDGCTALRTVRVAVADPSTISLGEDVFKNVNLAEATLYVPRGCKAAYAAAPVWSDFGTIEEMRTLQLPDFVPLTVDEQVYIYNIGTRKFAAMGEAYGTQAVGANAGLVYRVKRQNSMAAGRYYLQSDDLTSGRNVLFRTTSDSKVGTGVKACFADGSVTANAHWTIAAVEGQENVYTLQVPEGTSGYTEGEYLGIKTDHESEYADGDLTYGLYWDINYESLPKNCQWAFVRVADVEAATALMAQFVELETLIGRAEARGLDVAAERAVLADLDATSEQVGAAIASLCTRLKYLVFADDRVKQLCVARFDLDEDEEVSADEAAAATTLGQVFSKNTQIVSFDELRYFTGLTAINADAFYGCTAMKSVSLPASVTEIGSNSFTGCTKLRYMRLYSTAAEAPTLVENAIPEGVNIFVEASALPAYEGNAAWEAYTVSAYTGQPIVTARRTSRNYGRANPAFSSAVMGAPVEGEPAFSCDADQKSPVGEYPIHVAIGTVSTEGVQLQDGVLVVAPGPLTIKAKSYSRNIGEENPAFELEYTGWRNRETAETALTQQPTVTCEATTASPAGEYEIVVAGAEAPNYEITYVAGVLTVIDPDGVLSLDAAGAAIAEIYTADGKRATALRPGINIVRLTDGTVHKVVVR